MSRKKQSKRSTAQKQAKKSEIREALDERSKARDEVRRLKALLEAAEEKQKKADVRAMKARGQRIKEAERKERKSVKEAIQRDRLATAIRTGLYAPKSRKLTKHRKAAITKLYKENRFLFDENLFKFVPITKYNKGERKKIQTFAENHGIKATKRGLFIEAKGEPGKVTIHKTKGGYTIDKVITAKRGKNKGKRFYKHKIVMIDQSRLVDTKENVRKYFTSWFRKNKRVGEVKVYIKDTASYISTYNRRDLNVDFIVDQFVNELEKYHNANTLGFWSIITLRYYEEADDE